MKLCPKCKKQFSDDANFCPVDAARLAPLQSQAVVDDSISAKYELGERLGGDRTGAVYRATDRVTGQVASVKIISSAVVTLPGLAQRFERELKQLERVQSAGVAKVLASGKRGEDSWVALELLDGAQTLDKAIAARGPIPAEQAAHLIEVVGEALIEAAQVGVVHRDLAPKNILFAGAEVKLINFSVPVPSSEKVPGVSEFVAPEQHDGKPVDQRSNLYSLGALYYFVLTGQPVQVDDSGAIKPPSALAPVPAPVEAVIMRALDRSPTKRFLTVRQFIDEVSRIAGSDLDARATQVMVRPGKPKAELVQTLLGIRGGGGLAAAVAAASPSVAVSSAPLASSTAVGIVAPSPDAASLASAVASTIGASVGAGAGPAMPAPLSPQAVSPERSPWAPSPDLGPQDRTANPATAPGSAAPATVAPGATEPAATAPEVPPESLASTSDQKSSKSADGSKDGGKDGGKDKFRETMWFKKGELDAQAAQAAAAERAKTGKDVTNDKVDSLPIDERYKDDGSLSRSDKEKYSLRTGATTSTNAIRKAAVTGSTKVSEDALIDEMKGGRKVILAAIAAGLVVLAVIVFLIVH